MKRITITVTCVLAVCTVGALPTAQAYSDGTAWGGTSLLTASFFGSQSRNSTTSLPTSVSPLVAQELTVLTNQGIAPAEAMQALDVQAKVANASLPGKLQAAMGSNYAGVWFDNAAAQLDVGATSATGRAEAEAVVAQAGLAGVVRIVPVRSTMAQLLKTQNAWNSRLADLFAQRAVETGIEPQSNALSVTVGSALSASRRAALRREADNADVNVKLSVAASPGVALVTEAGECNKFTKGIANCNPSLTAGVGIQRPEETTASAAGESHSNTTVDGFAAGALANVLVGDTIDGPGILEEPLVLEKPTGTSVRISRAAESSTKATFTFLTGALCTAGPLAVPVSNRNERVVLTAGHCIEGGHGVGQEWFAYNRANTKLLIGKSAEFRNGTNGAADLLGDFGSIKIEAAGGWQENIAATPVLAVVSEWLLPEETRYKVRGERLPAADATDCHEGLLSGQKCGVITQLNISVTGGNGKLKEGLVQDTATSEGGDSGGPWLFAEPEASGFEALMEGTHVGKNEAGNLAAFDPLKQPEPGAARGSLEVLNLELLTTSNETLPTGQWDVNKTKLTGSAPLANSLTVLSHGEIAAGGLGIICSGSTVGITFGELVADEIRAQDLTFSECKANAPCKLGSTTILTLGLHGLAQLDGTANTLVTVLPLPSKTLAAIKIEGAECAFAGVQPLTGTIDFLIDGGQEAAASHVVLGFSLKGALKLGSTEATFVGFTGDLKLASEQTWNFL